MTSQQPVNKKDSFFQGFAAGLFLSLMGLLLVTLLSTGDKRGDRVKGALLSALGLPVLVIAVGILATFTVWMQRGS
jgi:ABC-type Fe3+ transport system permease subunit